MKISAILVAGAQAWRCGNRGDFGKMLREDSWQSVVETLNFASNNWEKFTNVTKSVSRTDRLRKMKCFRLMRQYFDHFSTKSIPMAILKSA